MFVLFLLIKNVQARTISVYRLVVGQDTGNRRSKVVLVLERYFRFYFVVESWVSFFSRMDGGCQANRTRNFKGLSNGKVYFFPIDHYNSSSFLFLFYSPLALRSSSPR